MGVLTLNCHEVSKVPHHLPGEVFLAEDIKDGVILPHEVPLVVLREDIRRHLEHNSNVFASSHVLWNKLLMLHKLIWGAVVVL